MESLKISYFHANVAFTMREFDMTLDWERKLLVAFVLVSLGTFLGPFGTYDIMGLWDRLTFWTLDVLGAGVLMHIIAGTIYNIDHLRRVPPIVRLVIGVCVAAVPTTAFIRFIFMTVMGPDSPGIHFPLLWAEVCAISTLVLIVEYDLIPRLRRSRGHSGPRAAPLFSDSNNSALSPAAPAPAPRPNGPVPDMHDQAPLLDRLPDEARPGRLISISMQDHYAAITMTTGTYLVLLRMSDALELLGGIKGAQVHRSHWAAAEFAKAIHREGRRAHLQLTDGRSLPISASYLSAAKTLIPGP